MLHIEKGAVRANLARLAGLHLLLENDLSVLLDQDDVGMIIRDPDLRTGITLPLRYDQVKDMVEIHMFDLDLHVVEEVPHFIPLFLADTGDDLQLPVRISRDDPCRCRGRDSLQVVGVRDDDAFHVLDDTAAGLHQHPVRKTSQDRSRLRRSIGQGNRLRTSHGRNQFLFQDGNIGAIPLIGLFHTYS